MGGQLEQAIVEPRAHEPETGAFRPKPLEILRTVPGSVVGIDHPDLVTQAAEQVRDEGFARADFEEPPPVRYLRQDGLEDPGPLAVLEIPVGRGERVEMVTLSQKSRTVA